MVDFSLTDEQREVARTARTFAEREILPRIHEMDSTSTYDRTLYEKMGAVGFLGLPIPERYGGSGMDYIAFAQLCEEMERADTAFRVVLSVHTGLNSLTLLQWAHRRSRSSSTWSRRPAARSWPASASPSRGSAATPPTCRPPPAATGTDTS